MGVRLWMANVVRAAAMASTLLLQQATVADAKENGSVAVQSQADDATESDSATKAATAKPSARRTKSPFPQYRANPANGATDVDPGLKELVIRFDREMEAGMSITGDPSLLPPIDPTSKPGWRDRRTFVLPVKLAEGAYYRIGINSKSHRNFRDSRGTPAPPTVIAFTTKGASKDLVAKLAAPRVVSTEPPIGAKEVDAAVSELKVTFDAPMGGGMSFVGKVPAASDGRPAWSEDGRTITLPITLEPGQTYRFGLNSARHVNFQSKGGVPLEPVAFEFSTAAEKK